MHDPINMIIICFMVFLAGLIDSIAGGGGLISLPAYLFIGLPAHIAYGCNKFTSSCGTTIATLRFLKNKALDFKVALISAGGALIGSAIGAQIVLYLDDRLLKKLLLILLPFAAFFIIFKLKNFTSNQSFDVPLKKRMIESFFVGIGIGLYDGMFGPGTGTFAIIAFTTFLGYNMITASGNAKLLNLASNYASLVTFICAGTIDYYIAVPAAICNIIGNYIGSGLAIKKGAPFIRPVMLVVLAILMVKIILDMVTGA